MAEDSAAYFKEDYSAIIAEIAAEAGREAALKAREEEQQQARTLTEQEEAQLARSANQALTLENCLKAITRFKRFWALVFAFVALILLFTAGWWWWISKKCDEIYKAQYEAKTAAYIAQVPASAAWAMSKTGQEAQALDKMGYGYIQQFYHCKLKGFYKTTQDGRPVCFPDGSGGGWWLPDSD